MKKLSIILLMLMSLSFISCTENSRAKNFGGNAKLDLPTGEKLVLVTWKDDALWTLTRDMKSDEVAETYKFKEKSSLGMLEGSYTIIEHK
jgi:hypothetical protein